MNDTAENQFYDAYRSALMKDGINQKSVLFSAPVKKFNRHGKVCLFVLFSKILKLKIIEIMKWNFLLLCNFVIFRLEFIFFIVDF